MDFSNEDRRFFSRQIGSNSGIPGLQSEELWNQEKNHLAPGLQQVVQWARLCIEEGRGCYIRDTDGNVYIDFMGGSGVNSIGHSNPEYIMALSEQMNQWMIGGFTSNARLSMLATLNGIYPKGLDSIQLYSGGSEAVEAAFRLAKSYTKKSEFLGFWNGFHGKTLGSIAITDGANRGLGPNAPGFQTAPYAYCYRCPLRLQYPDCDFACVDHVRDVIKHGTSGSLAGIVVEPIQGRAGNVVPPRGYLEELLAVTREHDALLIVDESITGFGRTGSMFACEYENVVPDILIVGKGMGNGYPVTGVISSKDIFSASPFSEPSSSSSSYGGFPLACRAVDVTIQTIIKDNLVQNSLLMGDYFLEHLLSLETQSKIVGKVYGRGLMIGIELTIDKPSKTPIPKELMEKIFLTLLEKGLLVMVGGNSIRLYPPLNVEKQELDIAIEILNETLCKTEFC